MQFSNANDVLRRQDINRPVVRIFCHYRTEVHVTCRLLAKEEYRVFRHLNRYKVRRQTVKITISIL